MMRHFAAIYLNGETVATEILESNCGKAAFKRNIAYAISYWRGNGCTVRVVYSRKKAGWC